MSGPCLEADIAKLRREEIAGRGTEGALPANYAGEIFKPNGGPVEYLPQRVALVEVRKALNRVYMK